MTLPSIPRGFRLWALLALLAAAAGLAAPRAAAEGVEADDAATSMTVISAADLNKALSNDLVTLDTARLRELLGKDPEFVYDPHNRRDPMLLPWTHLRVRAGALLVEANRAFQFGNLDLAERIFNLVRDVVAEAETQQLPGAETFDKFRAQADAGLQKVSQERDRARVTQTQFSGAPGAKSAAQLPVWVRTHTNGVLFSSKEPLCLVGTHMLKVGDKVPGQGVDVVVEKIEKRAVTYRVAGETFVVSLEEGE